MSKDDIRMRTETRNEDDFMTLRELARRMRVSPDTVRRQRIAGKLDALEWVDFFENGRPKVSNKSYDAFEKVRFEATKRIYSQSAPKSSGA